MSAPLPAVAPRQGSTSGFEERFRRRIEALESRLRILWGETSDAGFAVGSPTSGWTRWSNGRHTRSLLDWLADEVVEMPASETDRQAWRDRLQDRIQVFGQQRFAWPSGYGHLVAGEDFYESSLRFARRARRFDKSISLSDIGQALRNVWIVNSLQLLFGRPLEVSSAVFAYSMLYPYTDNYLDNPAVGSDRKGALNAGLDAWLAGRALSPADRHQAAVRRLVRMIEVDFPRPAFPGVHASLRAIHRGQKRSLGQQSSGHPLSMNDLLAVTFSKGGASVLVDGYLAAGELSTADEEFCLGYGVFLQLLDDLQDLEADRAAGHQTLFTRTAEEGPLDEPTARLCDFMQRVVAGSRRLAEPGNQAARDLILRNCVALLVGAVAESPQRYSRSFRRSIVRRWPLTLRAMRRLRRRAEKRFRRSAETLCQRRAVASILDLL